MPTNFFFILIPFNIVFVYFIRIQIQIGNGINEVKSNEGVTGGWQGSDESLTHYKSMKGTNERKKGNEVMNERICNWNLFRLA